jgi:hypothetical protein
MTTQRVRSKFKQDHQYELSPTPIPAVADGRLQLFCKCCDDPRSQSFALVEVKTGRQPDAIIAHGYERGVTQLTWL